MKCKICGDPIKRCPRRKTNNWCHYWHHNHRPLPDYGNSGITHTEPVTPIEHKVNKFRNVLIQIIWLLVTVGVVIIVVYLVKLLIPLL